MLSGACRTRWFGLILILAFAVPPFIRGQNGVRRNRRLRIADDDYDIFDEQAYIEELSERFQPRLIEFFKGNRTIRPRQVLHLHHMKTGGTSMDDQLACAKKRLFKQNGLRLSYAEVHECDSAQYDKCLHGHTRSGKRCRSRISKAAVLSYCAPLSDLQHFGWDSEATVAFTVLRHPVDRVWSMYRFQTKDCYQCRDLKEVYRSMEQNETSLDFPKMDSICFKQLENQQVRNLVSNQSRVDWLEQAKRNLRESFTMVGLTENLRTTHEMLSLIIPWISEDFGTGDRDEDRCELPHSNESPQNNRCGEGGTHLDLPHRPDEATTRLIEKHNQLDLELYEYAVELFEYQKRAVDLGAF